VPLTFVKNGKKKGEKELPPELILPPGRASSTISAWPEALIRHNSLPFVPSFALKYNVPFTSVRSNGLEFNPAGLIPLPGTASSIIVTTAASSARFSVAPRTIDAADGRLPEARTFR